ncbi:transcriptional regulator [Arsenophonus nasoniae]|uniref:Transcriptional regulator n=1 Tax=Arsenophonus nasoniae TaxID=638 RepID=D2U4A9_9GAMM|nr:hypothetical protein [Arsenophonus nasoniae]QBY44118.1 hypothetical protein ArsFIN_26950 [Arsenophonus nasoniae]WGM04421.1 transcriptional regulator [Arsenophonus nasoniae]WGM09525.1 transcriptional regulator [Arsenophonus nasoniae]WGM14246.1 transcriptional regulator [Arsenophonus nasoniae]CBA76392.1 conserved hypothetical protein [Arsenophonus nasoniae]
MLPLTEQQIKAYKQIFPELANDQLETAVLYAMGIPEKNIAFFRSVTYATVRKCIERIKQIYEVDSISHLRSVFQARIFHFNTMNCYKHIDNSVNYSEYQ